MKQIVKMRGIFLRQPQDGSLYHRNQERLSKSTALSPSLRNDGVCGPDVATVPDREERDSVYSSFGRVIAIEASVLVRVHSMFSRL